MLTANDIKNITFTSSRGKYKASEVDDFLDRCAETVEALTAAKAELEKKLEILADKLVEYRNDEDNIRTALLSAQKLGDTVVREAKHKAGLILDDAKIKAEKIQENAQKSIRKEEREMERIRREVSNFKARMLSIYREHLSLIDVLPEVKDETPEEEKEQASAQETVEAATEETANALQTEPAAPTAEEPDVPANDAEAAPEIMLDIPTLREEAEAEDDEDAHIEKKPADTVELRPTTRFKDLKFGDDYDISQEDAEETVNNPHRHK
ncbi:MAG: DivIVA domain-containing protein [Clostridiales bacterium]|jgi:cell division initiation protein|nr:DivIVA domain-containing protein [Clostridiales bacterium]